MSKKPKFSEMYSPSADVIGGNEDFLSQIFPHLPVKSLSRFKSVSKQWLALISHRDFCLSHACKNPSCSIPYGIFFYNPSLIDLWFCNYFSTDESNNSVSPSNSLSGQIPVFQIIQFIQFLSLDMWIRCHLVPILMMIQSRRPWSYFHYKR